MPKYEKLNVEEKECAEFLGLDPKKITQKEYKNIIDTLNAQKDNLNQASSSKSETAIKTKRKINRNKVSMEKKIRFLKNNYSAVSKSFKDTRRVAYQAIYDESYLNPDSPTFCNFCNKCFYCDFINKEYENAVANLSMGGVIKK